MDTKLTASLKKKKKRTALLENLTVAWVVKKLPAFYGPEGSSLHTQETSTGPRLKPK